MGRYSTTSIIRDDNGYRKLATSIIPNPDLSDEDVFIQITSTDRLDKLAHLFYQDSSLWWIIAAANNLGKGSWIVPENTSIRIPGKISILDQIREANRER